MTGRVLLGVALVLLAGCPLEVVPVPDPEPEPTPDPGVAECVVGGCSRQLCYEEGSGGGISTCEWRDEYACYQERGTCERQADGSCGWTETEELLECLDDPSVLEDCRVTGCGAGQYCTFCWAGYACIPEGAIC